MKIRPSDLDMARDMRRFWWVIPPFLMAGVFYVVLGFVAGPAKVGPGVRTDGIGKQFEPRGVATVSVRGVVGDIRIETTSDRSVSVIVTANGTGFGGDDMTRDLNSAVEFNQNGDALDVRVTYTGTGNRSGMGADILVRAPASTRIDAETGTGAITITKIAGDIHAYTRTGDITLTLPPGRPFSLTGDGRLQTEFPLTISGGSSHYLEGEGQALTLRAPAGTVRLRKG